MENFFQWGIEIQWDIVWEALPILAQASIMTVQATAIGYAIALALGLVLALMRRSRWRALAWSAGAFIDFVRGTPILVQLYFVFFVFPEYGITLPALVCGFMVFGVHYSAYTSEVYRAGLDSVPKGQWEAAIALNFSTVRVYRNIVIPQAIPPIVPALGNYLVGMFKETPLLAAIGVAELLHAAREIGNFHYRFIELYTLIGLFFIVMSLVAAFGIRRTEARLSPDRRLVRVQKVA